MQEKSSGTVQCVYEIWYHHVEFDVTQQLKEVALKGEFLWHQTMQMQDSGKPT